LALDSCRWSTAWHYGNRSAAHVKHTIAEHRCNKQHARFTLANWHSRPNTFDMALSGESASIRPRTDGNSDSLPTWLRFVVDGVSPKYPWCNGWFSVDKRFPWHISHCREHPPRTLTWQIWTPIPSQKRYARTAIMHEQPIFVCTRPCDILSFKRRGCVSK
jgi:hypothetical protein